MLDRPTFDAREVNRRAVKHWPVVHSLLADAFGARWATSSGSEIRTLSTIRTNAGRMGRV